MWTSIDLAEKKVSCCNTQQPSKSRNKTFHWKWTCRRRTYCDLNLARSWFWKLEANCKRISTCGQNLVQLGCVEEVLIRAWWEKTFRRQKMLQYEVSTETHSKKRHIGIKPTCSTRRTLQYSRHTTKVLQYFTTPTCRKETIETNIKDNLRQWHFKCA